MVDPTHARLSIVRQCRLVSVARSSFYYEGTGESPVNLRLMRVIDEQFWESRRFYGSRQMTRWLRRQGDTVSRKRVRRLMRLLGVHAIFQRPRTSQAHPAHRVYPYLFRDLQIHAAEPRVVHGWYLYPITARLSVSRRGDGLGEPQGPVLAPVQHARCALLCGRPCTRRSSAMALRRSLIATRAANSPASTSPTCSRRLASASRWTARAAGWTTCSSSGCGDSLKYECVYLSEFATGSQARTGIGWWMDFYDRRRPHSSLNDRTPQEAYTDGGTTRKPADEAA